MYKEYPETVKMVSRTGKVKFITSLGFECHIGGTIKPKLKQYSVTNANVKNVTSSFTSSFDCPLIDSYIDTPESENVEYKQTFASSTYEKFGQTIVAIANSGGGKLMWGIRDDLYIVGIANDYGIWDAHCLQIAQILKRCCAPKVPDIKFIEQRLSGKKNLYHVIIAPSCELISFNGVGVTRLAASNCVSKECKWVKLTELDLLKQQLKQQLVEFDSMKQKMDVLYEENNSLVIMLKQFVAKSNTNV